MGGPAAARTAPPVTSPAPTWRGARRRPACCAPQMRSLCPPPARALRRRPGVKPARGRRRARKSRFCCRKGGTIEAWQPPSACGAQRRRPPRPGRAPEGHGGQQQAAGAGLIHKLKPVELEHLAVVPAPRRGGATYEGRRALKMRGRGPAPVSLSSTDPWAPSRPAPHSQLLSGRQVQPLRRQQRLAVEHCGGLQPFKVELFVCGSGRREEM